MTADSPHSDDEGGGHFDDNDDSEGGGGYGDTAPLSDVEESRSPGRDSNQVNYPIITVVFQRHATVWTNPGHLCGSCK